MYNNLLRRCIAAIAGAFEALYRGFESHRLSHFNKSNLNSLLHTYVVYNKIWQEELA